MKKNTIMVFVVFLTGITLFKPVSAQIKVLNGGIGIGTETPLHPLDIKMARLNISQFNAPFRIEVANADPRLTSTSKVVFYNTSHTGHISVEASAFNTISDQRLKTNIKALSTSDPAGSPLKKILQLNGYTYHWKHEVDLKGGSGLTPQKQIGFLAQELEKVIPEAVTTFKDSIEIKAVTYDQIIPYLVEAIKEQQAVIKSLETRLEKMEANTLSENSTLTLDMSALSAVDRKRVYKD